MIDYLSSMQQLRDLLDFAQMREPKALHLTQKDRDAINDGISALKTLFDMRENGTIYHDTDSATLDIKLHSSQLYGQLTKGDKNV